ncbi:hypothetical protein JEQ12_005805 [Ovis aries]|uniref:Uncharacterized protein n=1 Tax=Ovis aries TaxID=9940 RepID=A0A835ZW03_SHEEP|nr:hypothetical protein JEQ12_005805 [Ovis aries]
MDPGQDWSGNSGQWDCEESRTPVGPASVVFSEAIQSPGLLGGDSGAENWGAPPTHLRLLGHRNRMAESFSGLS